MKNHFVEDGYSRLLRGQKKLSLEDIQKKVSEEMATATPSENEKVSREIEGILRQKNYKPSSAALW